MRWILYACRAPSWNWLDFQNKKKSSCNLFRCIDIIIFVAWGRSSAGRALDWQSRGQGFDPPRLHPRIFKNQKFASGFFIRAISRSNCLCDFSKKFLHGSIYSRILMNAPLGGVAQLGERLTGSQEVRGSIPLVSTTEPINPALRSRVFSLSSQQVDTYFSPASTWRARGRAPRVVFRGASARRAGVARRGRVYAKRTLSWTRPCDTRIALVSAARTINLVSRGFFEKIFPAN